MRKQLIKTFQTIELKHVKVNVDVNIKQFNYTDVSMNLNAETHWPYRKPDNLPVYVSVSIKQISAAVEKRISALLPAKKSSMKNRSRTMMP